MKTTAIDARARKLCRHTVVYTDVTDIEVVVMALQGRTTKSIARELKITPSMAQYRILKAQRSLNTRFRNNYRNCEGGLVRDMMIVTHDMAARYVRQSVATKFVKFAAKGVPRM